MTETAAAARFYVARTDGTIQRYESLGTAKATADALYGMGVVAPLVVVAINRYAALAKAQRCYRGEITTTQARKS